MRFFKRRQRAPAPEVRAPETFYRLPPYPRWDPLRCVHPSVSRDPLLGGYFCTRCYDLFKVVPDAVISPPRVMTLWQRVRWAFQTRTKVQVVPFVWTVGWSKDRDARTSRMRSAGMEAAMKRALADAPPPIPGETHLPALQFVERPVKSPTDEQLAKVYDSEAMRAYREGRRQEPKP